jgi:hypothetical protein
MMMMMMMMAVVVMMGSAGVAVGMTPSVNVVGGHNHGCVEAVLEDYCDRCYSLYCCGLRSHLRSCGLWPYV